MTKTLSKKISDNSGYAQLLYYQWCRVSSIRPSPQLSHQKYQKLYIYNLDLCIIIIPKYYYYYYPIVLHIFCIPILLSSLSNFFRGAYSSYGKVRSVNECQTSNRRIQEVVSRNLSFICSSHTLPHLVSSYQAVRYQTEIRVSEGTVRAWLLCDPSGSPPAHTWETKKPRWLDTDQLKKKKEVHGLKIFTR